MSKIQIITDSTAYFTREEAAKRNIVIVPLFINFCGQVSEEGFPGEFEAFFEKLRSSQEFPTTSQPSSDAFAAAFNKALKENKEVITLVISDIFKAEQNL